MSVSNPRILVIAGSDSGGGAGIQADIKTITMLGGHAMTAITAVTAQNTLGVQAIHSIPSATVVQQIRSCLDDIGADAIKIGMLGSADTAHAVADELARLDLPIVFDPVMVATSGAALADPETVRAFDRLLGLATVATPNTLELSALAQRPIDDELSQACAADLIMARTGCPAILAKGGHLRLGGETYGTDEAGTACRYDNATRVFDFLYCSTSDGWSEMNWDAERIDTPHTHGTGCTLASAIATGLGAGMPLDQAIAHARLFVRASLQRAPGLGHGHGPMGQQFATGFRCPA